MDLASLNIQRGRDHGLAPYNIWREQCGLKRFSDWEELEDVMDKSTVSRIENLYEDVDDIDLFTGGMAEKPVVGGIVGPTFACIIGQQFLNLRKGDRFWYENGNHPGAFTKEQLQEIRKTSLSRVVCDCMDDVKLLQPFAFLQPDQFANIRTECRGKGEKLYSDHHLIFFLFQIFHTLTSLNGGKIQTSGLSSSAAKHCILS